MARLRALRPGDSAARWALRWLQGLPAVAVVLSGMTTLEQIVENVETFDAPAPLNEAENALLLRWAAGKKRAFQAWKERFADRKEYKYFKCPGCGKWLRVPRHKGKIHINCRCGYTLYRRT